MKNILILHTQLVGNGGIPRFNNNFNSAIIAAKIISLNDEAPFGANKNKVKFLFLVCSYLIYNSPSVVIIGHLNLAPISFLVKVLTRAKCITLLHGVEAWYYRKKLKWSYRFIDEFWSVSNYTTDQFISTNYVPNFKLKTIFNTLPNNWPIEQGTYQPFFFSVARLDKTEGYKGVDLTIKAVYGLQELLRKKEYKYIVVASGDDVQRHENLARRLEVQDLVIFKSKIDDAKLQELYMACSFFILPSSGEGFGIVYLEAMACAKACIGSIGCGAEDVIENGVTGYLLDQELDSIQKSIQELVINKNLKMAMGQAGLSRLNEKFVFSKFEQRIVDLLK